jgi:Family of unknown function (DUF6340)
LVILTLFGCVPHVQSTVMEAADVDLPGPRLRVLDRVTGRNSAAAVRGLEELIGEACSEECDGTIEITALVYEEQVDTAKDGGGATPFTATRLGRVRMDWRLVDAEDRLIEALRDVGTLDQWMARGATAQEAQSSLPDADVAALDLAYSAGVAYGHRLSSTSWTFRREYFAGGPLRLGAIALRSGDPEDALVQWMPVAQGSSGPRRAARAHHDLAVAYELIGSPWMARTHLDLALALAAAPRTRRYADRLEQTRGVSRALRQFAPAVPGEPLTSPPPSAVPVDPSGGASPGL